MQYKPNRNISKSLSSLFQTDPELNKFAAKVEQLKQINALISSSLDPALADHCQVANFRSGTLILSTCSPAWNHKLRFAKMDLLSSLRTDPRWSGLRSIEIRVDYMANPEQISKTPPKKLVKRITLTNQNILLGTASGISNQRLALALKNLALKAT